MTVKRITLVIGTAEPGVDAIHDYSRRLAAALSVEGAVAEVVSMATDDILDAARRGATDAVVVQFNPFAFGRRGIAPGLVARLFRLRLQYRGVTVGVMCHETVGWLPGWTWRGVRQLHRLQLGLILASADIAWASTTEWLRELRRLGGRRATVLPVGSNLPDMRSERDVVRGEIGATHDRLVVATFSTGHMSHQEELVAESVRRLAVHHDVLLLTLGAGRSPLAQDGVREVCPGLLEPAAVARLLAAADLYICPYVDGVSTRRGTVMAALQHGLPVVGTVGVSTAPELRSFLGRYGVTTTSSTQTFADCVEASVAERDALCRHGERGRRLYETTYDWPVIARRLLSGLDDPAA